MAFMTTYVEIKVYNIDYTDSFTLCISKNGEFLNSRHDGESMELLEVELYLILKNHWDKNY